MPTPTISIVTPVRNGAATIADCLASVAGQSLAAEHVIVDACSTDGTLEMVRCLAPRARLISEPDQGIYDAMNKGIALATGEVVGILNCDDFYPDPDVLARVAAALADPDVDSCYGDLLYLKQTRAGLGGVGSFRVVRRWHSGPYRPQRFYRGWMPPHPTFFVRRSLYQRYGGFDTDFGTAADYELMLRFLLRHGISSVYIPRVQALMRTGGASNASLASRLRANLSDRDAWWVNGLEPKPWTLTLKPLVKLPQFVGPLLSRAMGSFCAPLNLKSTASSLSRVNID